MRMRSRIRAANRLRARHGIWAGFVDQDLASRAPNTIFQCGLATATLASTMLVEAEALKAVIVVALIRGGRQVVVQRMGE